MHLGLADAVTILLGGLGVVGVLAAAAAVARASSIKANLELLRGEVADLTASNARLDGENTDGYVVLATAAQQGQARPGL